MTVQMPNLALIETKRITVYVVGTETASSMFYFILNGKQTTNKRTKEQKRRRGFVFIVIYHLLYRIKKLGVRFYYAKNANLSIVVARIRQHKV